MEPGKRKDQVEVKRIPEDQAEGPEPLMKGRAVIDQTHSHTTLSVGFDVSLVLH
jgi:hypothetical protein